MTHASLFSGIGGAEIAAQMMGWTNLFHCEINPFGRAVLDYHFPKSVSYEDITKTDFSRWGGQIDVLTGGFPCQPFSYAGKRGGANDDRYLWPEMLRAIQECRPTWVIGENVAGITTMVEQREVIEVGNQTALFGEEDALHSYEQREKFTIERVCSDLESIGYSVQPVLIPACAVGAPHRRDRVFIIAHAENAMYSRQLHGQNEVEGSERNFRNTCTGDSERLRDETQRTDDSDSSDTRFESMRRERQDSIHRLGTVADSDSTGQSSPEGEDRRDRQTMDGRSESVSFDGVSRPCVDESSSDTASIGGLQVFDNLEPELSEGAEPFSESSKRTATDTEDNGLQHRMRARRWESEPKRDYSVGDRWQGFPTVSAVHRGNDGLPFDVDDITIPFVKWRPQDANLKRANFSKWRSESLKAYGNAIVPQVMYEIFRAIELVSEI